MRKVFKIDWLILLGTVMLIGIGLFTLYSLTLNEIPGKTEFLKKEFSSQLIFTFVGIILGVLTFKLSVIYLKFQPILILLFVFTLLLLGATLAFGTTINGVKRWLFIGGANGITIQASEFTKLAIIVITSALLSYPVKQKEEARNLVQKISHFIYNHRYILIALLANFSFITLIYFQRSLSIITISLFIIFALFFANIQKKLRALLLLINFTALFFITDVFLFKFSLQIKLFLGVGVIALHLTYFFTKQIGYKFMLYSSLLAVFAGSIFLNFAWNNILTNYQKDRIEAALSTDRDNKAEGYQQTQSKMSSGGGQVFGNGFLQVSDSRLLRQPEPTTDFIFSIYAFKFGFVGAIIMIFLYLLVILRLFYFADLMTDRFASLVLIGTAVMILIQMFTSIGINLDLLPVGGTTLPLISAGGSSLLTTIISIALSENLIATNYLEKNVHNRKDKVHIEGWNI